MRQYKYEVQDGADIPSSMHAKVYAVVCRSWDDFDDTAEAWVRVVNWYTSKEAAEVEAKAFQANADERAARTT